MTTTADVIHSELTKIAGQVNAFTGAQKQRTAALDARLLEVEQKVARGSTASGGFGLSGGSRAAALRAAIEGCDGLAELAAGGRGTARFDLPTGFFSPRAALTGAEELGQVERPQTIFPLPQPRLRLREVIPAIPTTAAAVSWIAEKTGSGGPEMVSEGTLKPETVIQLELKTGPVVTIATWLKASTQILSDIPALMNFIDIRLRYKLGFVEEDQLLRGSGVGNNLKGLVIAASSVAAGPTSDTLADSVRRACAELENQGFQPNAVVLNPTDWAAVELLKNTLGEYIVGQPRGGNASVLWNVSVISSPSQNEGTYLIGDFLQAAQIYDRWTPRVEIATMNEDDFLKNLCVIRVEERLALAVHQPAALRKGST